MEKSYKDLEIYKNGLSLFLKVHSASLLLPKYELYELGSQIRRSADSVITNIVEGYGRKRYKADFIKFLTYSQASNLETVNHLDKLIQLYPQFSEQLIPIQNEYEKLGAQIYTFIKYVEINWRT